MVLIHVELLVLLRKASLILQIALVHFQLAMVSQILAPRRLLRWAAYQSPARRRVASSWHLTTWCRLGPLRTRRHRRGWPLISIK